MWQTLNRKWHLVLLAKSTTQEQVLWTSSILGQSFSVHHGKVSENVSYCLFIYCSQFIMSFLVLYMINCNIHSKMCDMYTHFSLYTCTCIIYQVLLCSIDCILCEIWRKWRYHSHRAPGPYWLCQDGSLPPCSGILAFVLIICSEVWEFIHTGVSM